MTCEIAIMNRQAIALAADSATTVTQWIEGKPQPRYFKGANKIFQLSNHHPVGMMIYDTATLQEVPWELIVKDFRTTLGEKSFNNLEGYAGELFDFIQSHAHLFPADYQSSIFKEEAEKHAWLYLMGAKADNSFTAAADDAARSDALQTFFKNAVTDIEKQPIAPPFGQHDLESALAQYQGVLASLLDGEVKRFESEVHALVDYAQLAELGIRAILRRPTTMMVSTGVVIAGFGDHDFFPGYQEYQCFGLLLGRFLSKKREGAKITVDKPAFINAFATTSMVETFQTGYSPDVFSSVVNAFREILKDFGEKIRAELGGTDIPNLDAHIKAATTAHATSWGAAARSSHYWPLIRVIGALPVDEMAELAETLIVLRSLKEKVTQPTESVGGPVDVAVISKGDGFIWIKRKHYFDPKLNPRFFQRQQGK